VSARRQIIAALSEDRRGIATLYGVERAEQLTDAHRLEVLRKAVGRLRAIPVTCTDLTGPVWYGDGWDSAITQLEEIADYQTPDDEAFPGELERLRTLALQLRVAVIRKGDLAEAERLLSVYEEDRKEATASAATATPDFFQPGHTYTKLRGTWLFQCAHVATHPGGSGRIAFGWLRRNEKHDVWLPNSKSESAWTHDGWTDVAEVSV